MKQKHYLFLILFFVFSSAFFFVFTKKTEIDIRNTSTDKVISSKVLTEYFIVNEEKANITFKNKAIEINGKIKTINYINNKRTIVLHSNYKEHNVICEMQKNTETEKDNILINKAVTIKGICKGFLHDVIILNCIVLNIEDDE